MAFTARKQPDLTALDRDLTHQRSLKLLEIAENGDQRSVLLGAGGHHASRMFMHHTISRDVTGTEEQVRGSILAVLGERVKPSPITLPETSAASSESSTSLDPKAVIIPFEEQYPNLKIKDKYGQLRRKKIDTESLPSTNAYSMNHVTIACLKSLGFAAGPSRDLAVLLQQIQLTLGNPGNGRGLLTETFTIVDRTLGYDVHLNDATVDRLLGRGPKADAGLWDEPDHSERSPDHHP